MTMARPFDPRGTPRPALRAASLVLAAWAAFGAAQATDTASSKSAPTSASAGSSSATARYERERARCLSGQSQEDTKTCLKEAGAALQASRADDLKTADAAQLAANARRRCEVFKGDDKTACLARLDAGTVKGSVAGGGILREYKEEIPPPQPEAAQPGASATPAR